MPSSNLYLAAARAVMDDGRSLDDALAAHGAKVPSRRHARLREIGYGACRYYHYFDGILAQLLSTPLKPRDRVLRFILINGCYQLEHMRTPDYAALSESVEAVAGARLEWAGKMINGVLRNFLAERKRLKRALGPAAARFSYPQWLYREISAHWPDHFQPVLESGNRKPPLTVRVNQRKISRAAYLERRAVAGLEASPTAHGELGVTLAQPLAVEKIPGFAEGPASVQDESAQLAAALPLNPEERVLDGCAAPDGKTCLLLESQPKLAALAENLAGLGLGGEAGVGRPPLSSHFAGCAVQRQPGHPPPPRHQAPPPTGGHRQIRPAAVQSVVEGIAIAGQGRYTSVCNLLDSAGGE